MSEKELEIFKLGKDLANILSSNEAKADLKALYNKHPEMFKNLIEVKEVIQEVVSNPEVIKEAKNNIDVYAMKKLDKLYEGKEKIGDVVIGKNNLKIYHANKMRVSELKRIQKNINLEKSVGEDPHTLHMTLLEKSSCLGANKGEPLSGAKALSTDGKNIIQENNKKLFNESLNKAIVVSELKRIQKNINLEKSVDADPNTLHTTMLEKPHDLELMNKNSSGAKALSTDSKNIIQENNKKLFNESLNKAIKKVW